MLDIILIIILLFGIAVGLRRGFILQLIHMTGFLVAFIAAANYYDTIAPKLELWIPFPSSGEGSVSTLFGTAGLDKAYYNAIAFIIIFAGVKILFHLIGSMLDFIAQFPIIKQLNRWGGGLLGFLENYLIIFILLYIAALVPVASIQKHLEGSVLADLIVNHTPFLSSFVKGLWF